MIINLMISSCDKSFYSQISMLCETFLFALLNLSVS
jgi:hypothetical protein